MHFMGATLQVVSNVPQLVCQIKQHDCQIDAALRRHVLEKSCMLWAASFTCI